MEIWSKTGNGNLVKTGNGNQVIIRKYQFSEYREMEIHSKTGNRNSKTGNRSQVKNRKWKFGQKQETEVRSKTGNGNLV